MLTLIWKRERYIGGEGTKKSGRNKMDLMDMTHWQIGDPFSTLGSDEFEK
jgi:hypothetical protein